MKILQPLYEALVLLRICPPNRQISRRRKIVNIIVSITCPAICLVGTIASYLFFQKFFSTDLASAICAIYQIVAAVLCVCLMSIGHFKWRDIKKNFEDFESFCDMSKYFLWFDF